MIDLIAAAGIGGIIGMGIMAWRTAWKVAAVQTWSDFYEGCLLGSADGYVEIHDAHTRCADALGTTQRKLSAIRDLLDTPRTIRKGELAAVLDGDL